MTHEITHYLDIGFSEYLSKPIQREKLVHVINHCLGINSRIDEIDIPENNLCQLKNDFLDDLSLDIKNIKNAFSHKNWQQLQFFAHGLNGSSAVFGFKEITKLAAKLENGLQTGEFPTDRLKMQVIIDNLTTTSFSLIKK